jgi:hypothetical protein
MDLPEPGLYRTTRPYPGHEKDFPAGALVYVGLASNGGLPFVVRPASNRHNRWYYNEPTLPLRALAWAKSLIKLRAEGFYILPQDIQLENGGRWVKGAIVQLGYNAEGRAILFVAEQHADEERNVLIFSDHGRIIDDKLLARLTWAAILPVPSQRQAGSS